MRSNSMRLPGSGSFSGAPKRRTSSKELIGQRSGKFAIESYQRLARLVDDAARATIECLENLMQVQDRVVAGVQEFLSYDCAIPDESALNMIMESARLFDEAKSALGAMLGTRPPTDGTARHNLQQIRISSQDMIQELGVLLASLDTWAEACAEQEHYEDKVAGLEEKSRAGTDKLLRNREKLGQAKKLQEQHQEEADRELSTFHEKRSVFIRATLIAYMRTYVQAIAEWGEKAAPVADTFAKELGPGARARIMALQKSRELNGLEVTVESIDTHKPWRRMVLLEGAVQKSLAAEHLEPVPAGDAPSGSGAPAAEAQDESEASPQKPSEKVASPTTWPAWDSEDHHRPATRSPAAADGLQMGWAQVPEADEEDRLPRRIGFGQCARALKLSDPSGNPANFGLPVIAARVEGLLHGAVLTARPLEPCQPPPPPPPSPSGETPSPLATRGLRRLQASQQSFYFELKVLESIDRGTTCTLSLGFCWPREAAYRPDTWATTTPLLQRASSCTEIDEGHVLPEMSRDLPYSFVVGGDLPRAHLGGRDLGKLVGFRPLKDAKAGTTVGCLLERSPKMWRCAVFVGGRRRCDVEVEPPDWAKVVGSSPPHGVVDVCGSVRRVKLRQAQNPPTGEAAVQGQSPVLVATSKERLRRTDSATF